VGYISTYFTAKVLKQRAKSHSKSQSKSCRRQTKQYHSRLQRHGIVQYATHTAVTAAWYFVDMALISVQHWGDEQIICVLVWGACPLCWRHVREGVARPSTGDRGIITGKIGIFSIRIYAFSCIFARYNLQRNGDWQQAL